MDRTTKRFIIWACVAIILSALLYMWQTVGGKPQEEDPWEYIKDHPDVVCQWDDSCPTQ